MEQRNITVHTEDKILTIPGDFSQVRQSWIAAKETELTKAQDALLALQETDATERRIRRTKERVSLLKKTIRALKAGYIPIPRFDSNKLTLDMEELPVNAIIAVSEAKAQALFDEFRLITGHIANNRRGRYGRIAQRDPLIVGVVRTPSIVLTTWQDGTARETWSAEEHFLIAWWRPEDENLEDMF